MLKKLKIIKRKLQQYIFKVELFFRKKRNRRVLKKNIKKRILPVELRSSNGIGGRLITLLHLINYCDKKNLIPIIRFTHANSKKKEEYFNYFFFIKIKPKFKLQRVEFAVMKGFSDLNLDEDWHKLMKGLSLERAYYLIDKYIGIKSDIKEQVDSFYSKHFKNKNILGIHYRATDKKAEADLISFDNLVKNIKKYLKKHPETEGVFISTDDNSIITKLQNVNLGKELIFHHDNNRSNDDKPPHFSTDNLYEVNYDAIVNCLLLSRCSVLMKTASILSACSKLFNPNIPLIILSKPREKYLFFPESKFKNDLTL